MVPMAGERLYLKSNAPGMPHLSNGRSENAITFIPVSTFTDNDFIVHTVQAHETIYAISKKYSVAIDDVMKWNEMQSIDLRSGQQLRIRKKA